MFNSVIPLGIKGLIQINMSSIKEIILEPDQQDMDSSFGTSSVRKLYNLGERM